MIAALGGLTLLAVMFVPWFEQRSAGGIAGLGRGDAPVDVTAWAAFGHLAPLLAIAAALPFAHGALRSTAGWTSRVPALVGGVVALGLVLVGSARLVGHRPCCDVFYTMSSPRMGMYLGLAAAATEAAAAFTAVLATRRIDRPQTGA